MNEFLNITKALADETRVRTLMALRDGELCVCQITELCGLAQSTMSKHLSILYQAGLVHLRKNGRWIYYSLPGKDAPPAVRKTIDWVNHLVGKSPRVLEDAKRLKQVLAW